jgi:hypothetical protein
LKNAKTWQVIGFEYTQNWGKKYGLHFSTWHAQRPDISFIWGCYILSISRPQKRILYPISITAKKRIWIYILYPFVKIFASIFTFSEQQKATPGSTAAHKSSIFNQIELKPWSISSAARKWQITAEMAETAVLKENSCL